MPVNLGTARGDPRLSDLHSLWSDICFGQLSRPFCFCLSFYHPELTQISLFSYQTHLSKASACFMNRFSWIMSVAKFLLYSHWHLLAEIHWWSHEALVILTKQVHGTDVRRRMSPLVHEWSRVWWHPKDPVCPNCYSRGYVGSYPGSLDEEILSQNTLE